jgi:GT2 family glycosyltransferase
MTVQLSPATCAGILINYNGAARTLACVQALARLAVPPGRLAVVDNGSAQGEPERLLAGWTAMAQAADLPAPVLRKCGDPPVGAPAMLLTLPENQGFAAGNNAALRLLLTAPDCRAFWLLNNDTEPAPQALEALCARLNQRPDAGLCGSTLVLGHDPQRLQCAAGGAFSPWLAATRHLGQGADLAQLPDQAGVERGLDYINGASLLVRREVIERIGLLPEEYFLYCEDVDFCLRARRAGFGLAWAPDSVVLHHEGGSSGAKGKGHASPPQRSRLMDYLMVRNRFHLVRSFQPLALPTALATLPLLLANRIRRGQADRCGLLLRAVVHGLAGRQGKPGGIA